MKKFLFVAAIFLSLFVFPLTIFAHGGVEKRAENILVTLFQTPLSPFVGEKVNFAFILTDISKNTRLVNKSARLVVTQTALGDPKKDKVILTQNVRSDVNGTINFSYAFPSTNYYDIDLQLGKAKDEGSVTGFLVQPRENNNDQIELLYVILIMSLLMNVIFLFVFLRFYKKKIRSIEA